MGKEEGAKNSEKALDLAREIDNRELAKAAKDLVENQGKKKAAPSVELAEVTIIHNKTRIAFFDEFESRRARHMAKAAASESAVKDAAKDINKQKVEYTIRWQLVSDLNLSSMPIPR